MTDDEATSPPPPHPAVGRVWVLVGATALMVLALALGFPAQSGPDEDAHLVRSAALARGQVLGDPVEGRPGYVTLDSAPVWAAEPDANCFKFQVDVSSACALESPPLSPPAQSSAGYYPPAAHLLPGIGTLIASGRAGVWWARLLSTLPSIALLSWSFNEIRRRGRRCGGAATFVALTPAAVMTLGFVNPSTFAITGAVAVVTGLGAFSPPRPGKAAGGEPDSDDEPVSYGAGTRWLAVAGVAALATSRADGVLWAFIVVVLTTFALRIHPRDFLSTTNRLPVAVAAVVTISSIVWTLLSPPDFIPGPSAPGGAELVTLAISRIGGHFEELVGVFAWVDNWSPRSAMFAWWLTLGVFSGALLVLGYTRRVAIAAAGMIAFVVIAVAADIYFAPSAGLIWQGRYEYPLVIAAIMLLGFGIRANANLGRVAQLVGVAAVLLWNVTLWQALRRWGDGTRGTLIPWRWNLGVVAIPPMLTILMFGVGSAAIAWELLRDRTGPARPVTT